jgi:hypothetical protein
MVVFGHPGAHRSEIDVAGHKGNESEEATLPLPESQQTMIDAVCCSYKDAEPDCKSIL